MSLNCSSCHISAGASNRPLHDWAADEKKDDPKRVIPPKSDHHNTSEAIERVAKRGAATVAANIKAGRVVIKTRSTFQKTIQVLLASGLADPQPVQKTELENNINLRFIAARTSEARTLLTSLLSQSK